MKINNDAYGGFIVSKNALSGRPVLYTYREESAIPQLNGWTVYSCDDDQKYIENPDNFCITGADTVYSIAPVLLEIFDAPYGTDLCWMYEDSDRGYVHVGFYDLANNKDTTIEEILRQ